MVTIETTLERVGGQGVAPLKVSFAESNAHIVPESAQ